MCFKFKYFLEFSIFLRNTYRTKYTYYHTTYCSILRNKKKNPVQLVKHYYYFFIFLSIYLSTVSIIYLPICFIYLSIYRYLSIIYNYVFPIQIWLEMGVQMLFPPLHRKQNNKFIFKFFLLILKLKF